MSILKMHINHNWTLSWEKLYQLELACLITVAGVKIRKIFKYTRKKCCHIEVTKYQRRKIIAKLYLSRAVHSRIAVMMPLLCPSTTATVPSCLHAYPFCKGRTINFKSPQCPEWPIQDGETSNSVYEKGTSLVFLYHTPCPFSESS